MSRPLTSVDARGDAGNAFRAGTARPLRRAPGPRADVAGRSRLAAVSLVTLLLGACAVGPNYSGPPPGDFPPVPAAYKQPSSRGGSSRPSGPFADARPADKEPRGPWWRLFHDTELDRLEAQALAANQDLRVATSRIAVARAQTREAAADFYPDARFEGSAQRQRTSDREPFQRGQLLGANPFAGAAGGAAGGAGAGGSSPTILLTQPRTTTQNLFRAPVDLNWELDLFGRVRRNTEAARADRESVEADFHNMSLSVTANVAVNYFALRALDRETAVLERTIATRKDALRIANERLEAGLTGELDVSRARADLANNEADLFGVQRTRGEMENALATLLGQPASTLRLARRPIPEGGAATPPRVPTGLPSRMLERRPDVARAERELAAANARVGVAVAAFFPQIRLTGAAGFESADLGSLFALPARFWQIGPSITLPIFQGGRNVARLREAQARYEEGVGRYRAQVLVAFQEVENALVDLRTLAAQAEAQGRAVEASRRTLSLAQDQYQKGAVSFLEVLDAQRTLLASERISSQLLGQRLQATVNLLKALGGDWG